MGMLFGGWLREEEEEWKYENEKTGVSWEDWQAKKEYEYNNRNLTYTVKCARFRGIKLKEGDLICKEVNGDTYICKDFQIDGRPIVDLVSIEKHDFWNKLYPYDALFKIGFA